MKAAVFCCQGLGDLLITLVLSNNLKRAGYEVTTFHPFLQGLQPWFPTLPLAPFPETVDGFDRFFIIYERTPRMFKVLEECQKKYPDKTTVLNPIATFKNDYAYWEQGRFEGTRSFVDNLYFFCKDILQLPAPTIENGIVIPPSVTPRKFLSRVVIHPTSALERKNWPKEKFLQLASALKAQGLEPVFILTPEEKKGEWKDVEAPSFASLSDLVIYVCESGYMIGNDSGIGHLASCLGLPTLTLCRSERIARFWRPGWSLSERLYPSLWIPNLKFCRLRETYWKKWITVNLVLKEFAKLRAHAP